MGAGDSEIVETREVYDGDRVPNTNLLRRFLRCWCLVVAEELLFQVVCSLRPGGNSGHYFIVQVNVTLSVLHLKT